MCFAKVIIINFQVKYAVNDVFYLKINISNNKLLRTNARGESEPLFWGCGVVYK